MPTPVKKVTITIPLVPLKWKEVVSGKKEPTGSSTFINTETPLCLFLSVMVSLKVLVTKKNKNPLKAQEITSQWEN